MFLSDKRGQNMIYYSAFTGHGVLCHTKKDKAKMYTKDKNVRITFRCDEVLSEWLTEQAQILGLKPSGYVRQSLFSMMANQKRLSNLMEKTLISSVKAVNEDEHNTDNK